MSSGPSYTVRRWSGLIQLAVELVPALAVGLLFVVWKDQPVVGGVFIAVVVALAASAFDRATLAFRVDASGVTWSRRVPRVILSRAGVRRLDWGSVHDLEVVEGELVRARLKAGAPLPGFLRSRVVDAADPGAMTVVQGDAPGVDANRVRDVAIRMVSDVSVSRIMGNNGPGRAESGR